MSCSLLDVPTNVGLKETNFTSSRPSYFPESRMETTNSCIIMSLHHHTTIVLHFHITTLPCHHNTTLPCHHNTMPPQYHTPMSLHHQTNTSLHCHSHHSRLVNRNSLHGHSNSSRSTGPPEVVYNRPLRCFPFFQPGS